MSQTLATVSALFLALLCAWFGFDQTYMVKGWSIDAAMLQAQVIFILMGVPLILLSLDRVMPR